MYISDVLEYKMPSLLLTAGSVVGFKWEVWTVFDFRIGNCPRRSGDLCVSFFLTPTGNWSGNLLLGGSLNYLIPPERMGTRLQF
jgi:hypothetical protein